MRLRSIIMIPPSGEGLDAALESAADGINLTLADESVAVGTLRRAAEGTLGRIREAGKLAVVTVNHPRTQLLRDDIDAIVTPDLAAVFLSHATEPQDVRDIAVLLREFEYGRGIEPGTVKVFPIIDSARGLMRAYDIVQAAPRVGGLVYSGKGYARDIGAREEEVGPRLAYARGAVVAAARAADTLPLVSAGSLQLQFHAQHGFAGALVGDAMSAGAANMYFTPNALVKERAERVVAAYDAARGEGAWVGRSDGVLADAHAARKARQVLEHFKGEG
jgi:citrate lyase subunit beta / citryl-CoA lyase